MFEGVAAYFRGRRERRVRYEGALVAHREALERFNGKEAEMGAYLEAARRYREVTEAYQELVTKGG